jgi:hypothetical protein
MAGIMGKGDALTRRTKTRRHLSLPSADVVPATSRKNETKIELVCLLHVNKSRLCMMWVRLRSTSRLRCWLAT